LIPALAAPPHTHAAIFCGDGQCAETAGLGLRMQDAGAIVTDRFKVMRLKGETTEVKKVGARAAEQITNYLDQPHWAPDTLRSLFRDATLERRPSLLCSYFVARIYSDIDTHIFDGREALKTTIEQIQRSPKFQDITPKTTWWDRASPQLLLQSDFATLSSLAAMRIQSMYIDLVPFFESRNIAVPLNWMEILVFLAETEDKSLKQNLDQETVALMRKHKYLDFSKQSERWSILPFEVYLDDRCRRSLSDAEIAGELRSLKQHLTTLEQTLVHHQDNHRVFSAEFAESKLETFRLLETDATQNCQICARLIELSKARIAALESRATPVAAHS